MLQSMSALVIMTVVASAFLGPDVSAQDTVVVAAESAPVWGDDARLVRDLRIGVLEGPDEYIFGDIVAVAVGLNGSIYVYDSQVPVIRQYGPAGRYVRDVGRDGQGPGEYLGVMGMHVLRDGLLAVWDGENTRITVYDSAGNYLDSHRVPTTVTYMANIFAVDTAGYFYIKVVDRSRIGRTPVAHEIRAGQMTSTGERPTALVRVSPGGQVLDSIPLPLEEKGAAFHLATVEGPRWNFPTAVRYAWSNRGYLVVGRNDRYAFDLLIPGGPVRRIVRDYQPVRTHRAERAQWDAWARYFERGGGEKYPPTPETKPAFRDLYVDEDGRIWVDRYVEAVKRDVEPREPGDERPLYEWHEPSTFDVIGPDGTYLGTVVVPERTRIVVRRGDRVWGIEMGKFDEQYVVGFQVVGRDG
ncbi:MAG: 6-bladed beta-propeller [Gemmatimonadales bacterium]|jgi:hypothetical protein